MAYNFTAEKNGFEDIELLHSRLCRFQLVEFFPIEITADKLILGISIPFKLMDDLRFTKELTELMTYLISRGFQLIDLYTGDVLRDIDIAGLAARISA